MSEQTDLTIRIEADGIEWTSAVVIGDDGRRWLDEARSRTPDGRIPATLGPSDGPDTAGHAADIVQVTISGTELDTEGHAITLRLPTPHDAEELKRRLAIGALAVTIAAGAGAAVLSNQGTPSGITAPVTNLPAPAVPGERPEDRDIGLMDGPAQYASQQFVAEQGPSITGGAPATEVSAPAGPAAAPAPDDTDDGALPHGGPVPR